MEPVRGGALADLGEKSQRCPETSGARPFHRLLGHPVRGSAAQRADGFERYVKSQAAFRQYRHPVAAGTVQRGERKSA